MRLLVTQSQPYTLSQLSFFAFAMCGPGMPNAAKSYSAPSHISLSTSVSKSSSSHSGIM